MMAENRGVRVVGIHFQAKPQSEATLSREESLALSTEAFPRSLPLDVRGEGGFQALKLFPAGAAVGVSHAFDGGAVDEWDRPVLSARVALLRPGPENGWGREVSATAAALAALAPELAGTQASAARVAQALAAEGILASRERWSSAIEGLGLSREFLARASLALSVGEDIVLLGEDTPEAREILTLCLALAPPPRLAGLRVCTVCHNPEAEARETAIFQPRAPAERRGLWSRLSGKPGPSDRILVDLSIQEAPVVRGAGYRPEAFAAALAELLDAEAWPGLGFTEMHRQMLLCLDALMSGRPKRLAKQAAGEMPKETIARLKAFVKKAGG